MKRIGILGGLGAAAGVHLAGTLVAIAQERGATKDSDFPEFLLYNYPFEGMDAGGEITEDLVNALSRGLTELSTCPIVIIACNSAHAAFDLLQRGRPTQLIHVPRAACDQVRGNKVAVLCSQGANKARIYQKILEERQVEVVQLSPDQQEVVDLAIYAGMTGKCEDAGKSLVDLIEYLSKNGVTEIILGCTELPIVVGHCLRCNYRGGKVSVEQGKPTNIIDAGSCACRVALEAAAA